MQGVNLCLITLTCLLAHLSRVRTESAETRERVAVLESQVERLTNEMTRMKTIVENLSCVRVGPDDTMTSSGPNTGSETEQQVDGGHDHDEEEEDGGSDLPFQIREVRIEELPAKLRLSVQYWAANQSSPVFSLWTTRSRGFVSGQTDANVSDTNPGLGETSVYLDEPEENVHVWVSSNEMSYSLKINGSWTGTDVERGFAVPRLDTVGEIVYERGQNNITFDVITDKDDHLSVYGIFVDLDTRQLLNSDPLHPTYKVTEKFLDTDQVAVYLNNEGPISGIVTASVRKRQNASLVLSLELTRFLVLRPSDQSGPFPSGFLEMNSQVEGTESDPFRCNVSSFQECMLECSVTGTDVRAFKVLRLYPEGRVSQIPDSSFLANERFSFIWFKSFKPDLPTDTSPQSGDMEQVYECVALGSDYAVVTQTIYVELYS